MQYESRTIDRPKQGNPCRQVDSDGDIPDQVTRAAWLTALHVEAARRWLAFDPPQRDEASRSLRAIRSLLAETLGASGRTLP